MTSLELEREKQAWGYLVSPRRIQSSQKPRYNRADSIATVSFVLLTCIFSDLKRDFPSLLDIPDSILRAELSRRGENGDSDDKPSCGSSQRGAYNTPVHVMALFLILVLSTLGMFSVPCR